MAITYPVSLPDNGITVAQINITANNAVAVVQSPFTFQQQTQSWGGEYWTAEVSLPPCKRVDAEDWVAFLLSLRGQTGYFLMGDPVASQPRGTVSSCALTGNTGDQSVSVVMTGTLLRGDYIQLGTGANARLHKVLVDQDGDGTLEIWPALRTDYAGATVTTEDAKGVFRLSESSSSWSINEISSYGINFTCMEKL